MILARPKKKVILFIVEGDSDKQALERPIQTLLQGNDQEIEATFLIADGDVTSDSRITPDNIEQKINRFYFEPFFSANEFYYPKDIIEVVQICDLDGTFIPENHCKEYDTDHSAEDGFIYDPPYIFGKSQQAVIDRNRRKAENIRYLLSLDSIKVKSKTRPYSVYFFSSNIDHYLHDKLNLSTRDKINAAEKFADKCDEDPEWFLRRICQHSQAIKDMSHAESWAYIMSECNSVKRHTNFNLYINKLLAAIGSGA